MFWILLYLGLGFLLSLACKTHDDRRVWSMPAIAGILVLIWPAIVWRLCFSCQRIKWKDKVIWERKSKLVDKLLAKLDEHTASDVSTLVGGERLATHSSEDCQGSACCIHNPSDHHMVSWAQHWRGDRGIMERLCPHGIGHPDPDDLTDDTVHGCDGCCTPQEVT